MRGFLAEELRPLGIDVDCLPVLDLPSADAHEVIGDRAFARDPDTGGALGAACCAGLLEGGVLPVLKHIPGHGRCRLDSHAALPEVAASAADLSAHDFQPFRTLRDQPIAMTAHAVYRDLDPDRPATTSAKGDLGGAAWRYRISGALAFGRPRHEGAERRSGKPRGRCLGGRLRCGACTATPKAVRWKPLLAVARA